MRDLRPATHCHCAQSHDAQRSWWQADVLQKTEMRVSVCEAGRLEWERGSGREGEGGKQQSGEKEIEEEGEHIAAKEDIECAYVCADVCVCGCVCVCACMYDLRVSVRRHRGAGAERRRFLSLLLVFLLLLLLPSFKTAIKGNRSHCDVKKGPDAAIGR